MDQGSTPNDANADKLIAKCGTSQGSRTWTKPIPFSSPLPNPQEFCIALKDLIPQPTTFPANFYCAATAGLGSQESKQESPEFFFVVTGPELAAPGPAKLVP